jgi:hypothetical protein
MRTMVEEPHADGNRVVKAKGYLTVAAPTRLRTINMAPRWSNPRGALQSAPISPHRLTVRPRR